MKTFISLNILLLSFLFTPAFAQTSHVPWTKEDSAAIDALVLYPDSVRLDIFKACEYPAVIVNIASIQKNSSAAFANLLSNYSKEEQEDVWNMSRYPGLISQLAVPHPLTDDQINSILATYPAEIHDVALKYAKSNKPLLMSIDSLQNVTNSQFNQTISYYPQDVQQTFTRLLNYPEVMTLLNDHLSLTVRVGDHYKRDPQWVIQKADSNSAAQARLKAQEVNDWQQTINSDSNARNDLKNAANAYADSNGYADSSVDAPRDTTIVNNYSCYPYSYWFGYPTWYPYAYWYPYPYWYDWGFYYGPYGNLVIFGMPSFYFTNWYFYYPHHWHRYPYLGGAYVHHYYGPRRSYSENSMIVHSWAQNNRGYFPENFFTSRESRAESIKELGQMQSSLQQKPGEKVSTASKDQYLQSHPDKYPALNHTPQQVKAPISEERVPDIRQEPVKQPMVAPARVNTTPQPARTQQHYKAPTYRSAPANYNNVYKAEDYHRAQWQNSQPVYHSAPSPAPRSYSAPAPSFHSSGGGGGGGGRRR